jgi:monoamine oxidase
LRVSEWNGKLVFAGEATISEYEGSVHAALFSASNAAKSVRQYLKL